MENEMVVNEMGVNEMGVNDIEDNMEQSVANMVDILDNIKTEIKDIDYINLMNNLKTISTFKPKYYNNFYSVTYKIVSSICFIDDLSQFEDIKKDLYNDSPQYYTNSEEYFNEDYERMKEITTESYFYCRSSEIIDKNIHTPFEIKRLVALSKKHICDYYINPDVLEEHQREVQEYYYDYKNTWDKWVRIINDRGYEITNITSINPTNACIGNHDW